MHEKKAELSEIMIIKDNYRLIVMSLYYNI